MRGISSPLRNVKDLYNAPLIKAIGQIVFPLRDFYSEFTQQYIEKMGYYAYMLDPRLEYNITRQRLHCTLADAALIRNVHWRIK